MENNKVFITGSTGFIGCRLAEILYLKKSAIPICFVHNFHKAARLARLPVRMVKGDILDYKVLQEAMAGCQIVFHCAFGNTGNEQLDRRINEEGTHNILLAATENHVKRVVYISSVAVYGHTPPQEVDEKTPTVYSGWSYGDSKLNAEKICEEYMAKGLEVVIARPTIVYGPFSMNWTINALKRVQHRGWEKVKGLDGWCNPVYIDDLINGLLLCAEGKYVKGDIFILSGDETLTWDEYFYAYNRLASLPEIRVSSKFRVYFKSIINIPLRLILKLARRYFEKRLFEIYQNMNLRYPILAQKMDSLFRGSIKPEEFHFFAQKTKFNIKKAKAVLGYEPKYSFQDGIGITKKWLEHHAYID